MHSRKFSSSMCRAPRQKTNDQFVIGIWSFPRLFVEVVREQSGLMTVEYLDERAKRGSRKKFERAMAKVRDLKPEERDA